MAAMSRTVRRQLMEISDTLQKANELLANLFQGIQTEDIINLLTDCQNCAITMGNKIEAVYGTGTESVHVLEEYCESIFQISQHLDQLPECMKIYETSKEQLRSVRKYMEEEIPDKREVVFMPYKASMWDALESVYLAAREDENCEAYVVPIPYFDRKADKTLGEMHYEGAEYPKNIPITDWEEYQFEERLPDVIYIHNAYDDSNLVTCVHPRFFSSNLKKYTEKLVYIPYFVLEEIDPGDQAKIDGIKHFCFLPGIVNADKVILQSENMRQIYMNEYTKVIESAGGSVDRKQLEEKFLGTGSPKFDKVLNTRKEDLEIPEDWLRIIKKPDGSFKKIIFYNTGVTALLQHNEKMLTKMQYVFSVFKEHQDDVALLWRPHPLIKTTIESMRPQLWEEYCKIVEQYKEEGWGIYDDTADMDRAVILCDGYYGDASSVVQLVQKAGKPVMIQNVIYNDNTVLTSDGACLVGDTIWLVECETNSLCTLNLKNAEINLAKSFDENLSKRSIYRLCEYQGKIYGFPGYGKKICKYDVENNRTEYFAENTEKEIWCKYYAMEKYENYIYLFPMRASNIMKVDLEDLNNVEFIPLPKKKEEKNGYFTKRFIRKNNTVIIPCAGTNEVLFFDLESNKCDWKCLDFGENGFEDVENIEEKIYFLTRDKKIVETSYAFELERKLLLDEEYNFLIACHDNLILVPKHENRFAKIDTEDLGLYKIEYPKENVFCDEYIKGRTVTFSDIAYDKGKAVLIPRFNNMLLKIDKSEGTLSFLEWRFSEQLKTELMCQMNRTPKMFSETILKLEDFISI
ncbi:MAG: hypothetical protein ACI4ES_13655 [Roseburia sp.]